MSFEEPQELSQLIFNTFPKEITLEAIGHTYEGLPIQKIEFTPQFNDTQEIDQRVLITGGHQGIELGSIQMNFYLLLKMLFQYVNTPEEALYYMNGASYVFVPVINMDGFKYVSDQFKEKKDIQMIRKNRNHRAKTGGIFKDCSDEQNRGVDLNRNYPYKFGFSEQGSSSDECSIMYRGLTPFSEPETQAIQYLLIINTYSYKLAFNFHDFGDLYIHPFNYDNDTSVDDLIGKQQQTIYRDISNLPHFPVEQLKTYRAQQGKQGKQFNTNGEASDWMLGDLGIIAFSPTLGTIKDLGQRALVKSPELHKTIFATHSEWTLGAMKMLQSKIRLHLISSFIFVRKNEQVIQIMIKVSNKGLRDSQNVELKIYLENSRIEQITQVLLYENEEWVNPIQINQTINNSIYYLKLPPIGERKFKLLYVFLKPKIDFINSWLINKDQPLITIEYTQSLSDSTATNATLTTLMMQESVAHQEEYTKAFLISFSIVAAITLVICFILWSCWFSYILLKRRKYRLLNVDGTHKDKQVANEFPAQNDSY